jgi:hypothetical protein
MRFPESDIIDGSIRRTEKFYNPTDHRIVADLFVGPQAGRSMRYRYVWEPGETKDIPNELAPGLQDVRNGIVVGGLAPHLIWVGRDYKMHSCFDTASLHRNAAEQVVIAAEALKVASEKVAGVISQAMPNDHQARKGKQ